jgi:hypothetical protein
MFANHRICKFFELELGRYGDFCMPVTPSNIETLQRTLDDAGVEFILTVGMYINHAPTGRMDVRSNSCNGHTGSGTDIFCNIR